jgi:dihydroorotase
MLLKGARVIDPKSNLDAKRDILIKDRRIARVERSITARKARVLNARDLIVVPGLIDLHCHLRDPGRPDEETVETGSHAAVAGGFTAICCMPNTDPAIDNDGIVNYIYKEAARVGLCNVYPIGAITKCREGKELTEFGELLRAGAKGFSDDGDTVADNNIMRHAFEYSRVFDVPIFEHPIDKNLAQDGLMNEGLVSTRLGLKGSPAIAEELIVARDLLLAKFTGARLHLCHVSTKAAVELIRRAKKEGVRVTCETCPHYFSLTEDAVKDYDTNSKVNPPLRTERDIQAVKEGLRDGTIDVIVSDHAPHHKDEKLREFDMAPFGISGIETLFSLSLKLVEEGVLTMNQLIEKMAYNPAKILQLSKGSLKIGSDADVTIVDKKKMFNIESERFISKGENTPFEGWLLKGCPIITVFRGNIHEW